MTDIIWEDPPVPTKGPKAEVWPSVVAQLKKHPGKWAIVKTGYVTTNSAGSMQRYLKQTYRCEETYRKQPDGTYTLYARWPET